MDMIENDYDEVDDIEVEQSVKWLKSKGVLITNSVATSIAVAIIDEGAATGYLIHLTDAVTFVDCLNNMLAEASSGKGPFNIMVAGCDPSVDEKMAYLSWITALRAVNKYFPRIMPMCVRNGDVGDVSIEVNPLINEIRLI